jgi:pheromone shutdown-related protein TraB
MDLMDQQQTELASSEVSSLLATQPTRVAERDGVRYTLLGTAHVSKASELAVAEMVAQRGFDAVAVELDVARHQALLRPDDFQNLDLLKVIREGRAGAVAVNLALSAYQRRLAEQLGVEPGAELKRACVDAEARGLSPWLIDRAVGLTLKRAAAGLGFFGRFEMLTGIIASLISKDEVSEQDVEKLKEGDMLHSTFSEFARASPALYQGLIAERDRYMAAQLRMNAASHDAREVLAVVGAGHLAGIERELKECQRAPREVIQELDQAPPPSVWPKLFGWLLIAIIVGGLVYGFSKGFDVGADILITYLLLTSVGATVGAFVAGAHPLSALAGGLSAPLTVLHPALAAGMFSAAAEVARYRPTVGDFQALRDDVRSVRGWWRNRVARVLLIFMLTNVGTGIGVWITTFEVVRRLS